MQYVYSSPSLKYLVHLVFTTRGLLEDLSHDKEKIEQTTLPHWAPLHQWPLCRCCGIYQQRSQMRNSINSFFTQSLLHFIRKTAFKMRIKSLGTFLSTGARNLLLVTIIEMRNIVLAHNGRLLQSPSSHCKDLMMQVAESALI